MGLFSKNKTLSNIEKLREKYKSEGYETIPFISNEIEAKSILSDWNNLKVEKKYMTFVENNLIASDIIVLNWIRKNKQYTSAPLDNFRKRFGVDFMMSKDKLIKMEYISLNNQLSPNGQSLLEKYSSFINENLIQQTIGKPKTTSNQSSIKSTQSSTVTKQNKLNISLESAEDNDPLESHKSQEFSIQSNEPDKKRNKAGLFHDGVHCPYCRSLDVQFMQNNKKAFSVGKAAAGTILTGGIGSLAGFAGKKGKKNQWRCNDCGKTFISKK